MIKIVFCLRRRADMSLAEFQAYWRDTHAKLVAGHAETLGIKRYVQVHTDFGPLTESLRKSRGGTEPYDGVAEVWYESAEALAAVGDNPAARAAGRELYEDEKRFIDLGRSSIWTARENVVVAA
jgi:uncharacterized protein (TIGR02118 family)